MLNARPVENRTFGFEPFGRFTSVIGHPEAFCQWGAATRFGCAGARNSTRNETARPTLDDMSYNAPSPVTRELHPEHGALWNSPLEGRRPPAGTVLADPDRQNRGMWGPKYFYADDRRRCLDCHADFVFSATEQRFWYEALGFSFDSRPIRCAPCRRTRRRPNVLNARLAEAAEAARRSPEDADVLLDWAAAIIALHEEIGAGSIETAIANARKALRLSPSSHTAWYWQGRAHELADRADSAADAYGHFVVATRPSRRRAMRQLRGDAELRLTLLKASTTTDAVNRDASEEPA
ncbi:hypothetical protein STSO111631_09650 [Stackebrandtia soli]